MLGGGYKKIKEYLQYENKICKNILNIWFVQGPACYLLYLFLQQVNVTAYHGSRTLLVPKNTAENEIPNSMILKSLINVLL